MDCPICHQPLVDTDLSKQGLMLVHSCPACRGCWVDAADFEGVEDSLWASIEDLPVDSQAALSQVACPHCAVQLVTVSPADHPELEVDKCPSCHGFWMDHGELEGLGTAVAENAVEHGQRPPGWSALRWLTTRLAVEWWRHHPRPRT